MFSDEKINMMFRGSFLIPNYRSNHQVSQQLLTERHRLVDVVGTGCHLCICAPLCAGNMSGACLKSDCSVKIVTTNTPPANLYCTVLYTRLSGVWLGCTANCVLLRRQLAKIPPVVPEYMARTRSHVDQSTDRQTVCADTDTADITHGGLWLP